MKKQKFVVNAVRQLRIDNVEKYCELVNYLVNAKSLLEAENAVMALMKNGEKSFINADGQTGFWQFVEILSVNPIISEQEDITELQVQIFESLADLQQLNNRA